MYTVVLAVDTDVDRAERQASEIAQLATDGEMAAVIVHVFTPEEGGGGMPQVGSVRRARDLLAEADVEVTLRGESGPPGERIIEVAEDEEADLISVAGRKRSPAGKLIFGSVTQKVILGTDRPVLVSGIPQ